jgi:hypothetical protein
LEVEIKKTFDKFFALHMKIVVAIDAVWVQCGEEISARTNNFSAHEKPF